jgi:uncharacterized protein
MAVTVSVKVKGMHCNGCEAVIEESVASIEGIQFVKANFKKGTIKVVYDEDITSLVAIQQTITAKGYTVIPEFIDKKGKLMKITLSILALVGLFVIILFSRSLGHTINLPEINSHTSEGLIFIVGLLTGIHCVGMCGSFVIGYTTRDAANNRPVFRSHLLYGLGKTFSYTLFGALFGLIGALFTITPLISGITISIAGVFLILYGLSMFTALPLFKAIRLKQPAVLTKFILNERLKLRSPFFIGFFSGLILGCGPLQAMYVMAAGSGNVLEGAKLLTLFGLGTLPALFCFGLVARLFSNRMTRTFLYASGIILIVLGSVMLNKGITKASADDELNKAQQSSCCHTVIDKKKGFKDVPLGTQLYLQIKHFYNGNYKNLHNACTGHDMQQLFIACGIECW